MIPVFLQEHSQKIKDVAEAITSILGLSVTVVDHNLTRIAGTGIYKEQVGSKITGDSVFAEVIRTGESFVISNPKEALLCLRCSQRNRCKELAEVCAPILLGDSAAGVIAIFAEDEGQKRLLLQRQEAVMTFLYRMASLIAKELYSAQLFQELEREKRRLESTLEAITEGILIVDRNGRIVECNKRLCEYLDHLDHRVGGNVQELLSISPETLEKLFEGDLQQVNLSFYKNARYHQFICIPTPVRFNQETENLIFTVYPFHKLHRAVDRVLHGDERLTMEAVVGDAPAIHRLKEMIRRAASTSSTVCITGESGTGKELCARVIHGESGRCDEPFLAVNCATLPEPLFESELFGYEEGAFSGARRGGKPGMFELANKGTVFLDEISEIPLHLQGKLLRVLQQREIIRVGGVRTNRIDVRVITASNQDLQRLVREGRFRKDLFYRLYVIPIHIPPLRERLEDIPVLIDHFLNRFNLLFHKQIRGIELKLLEEMKRYRWPGNIRELENVVEYGVDFVDGELLDYRTLAGRLNRETEAEAGNEGREALRPLERTEEESGLKPREAFEKSLIRQMLAEGGDGLSRKREIARRMGISQATLYRRIRKYGLTT